MGSAVVADRIQFAFTVMFHYLFPIATIGLAPFIAWFAWRAARGDDEVARRASVFWTKIFAINFAVGVVTYPMSVKIVSPAATFVEAASAVRITP